MVALSSTERKQQIWSVVRVSSGNFLEMYDFCFWLLRERDRQDLLPDWKRVRAINACFHDIRGRLFGAPTRWRFPRRVYRPLWPSRRLDADAGTDGGRNVIHRLGAGVRDDWRAGAGNRRDRAAHPGCFRRSQLGGVSVYLSEIATPGHKGFYVSWQSGSQQVAVIFVALLGVLLSTIVPPDSMFTWGWRVPFLIGCLIIPFLFVLRSSLQETAEFNRRRAAADHPKPREILLQLVKNWRSS